jgi:hypothetical protein
VQTDQITLLFNALQFLLTGGIGFYVYLSNKNRVTNERVSNMKDSIDARLVSMESDIDTKLDNHSARITGVETTVRHLPTTRDIAELRTMVADVSGKLSGVTAEVSGIHHLLKPLQESVNRINDYLMSSK